MKQLVFAREREDLALFYGGAGPVYGLRAAGLERGGTGVFDEAAADRMHAAQQNDHHRHDLERMARIESVLRLVAHDDRVTFRRAFTPVGAGRASWRVQTAFAPDGQPLLGLVLHTAALAALYRARMRLTEAQRERALVAAGAELSAALKLPADPEGIARRIVRVARRRIESVHTALIEARTERAPGESELLAMLEREAEKLRGNRVPAGSVLHPPLEQAARTLDSALGRYALMSKQVPRRESSSERMARQERELEETEALLQAAAAE